MSVLQKEIARDLYKEQSIKHKRYLLLSNVKMPLISDNNIFTNRDRSFRRQSEKSIDLCSLSKIAIKDISFGEETGRGSI